jgi:hypothetical protein
MTDWIPIESYWIEERFEQRLIIARRLHDFIIANSVLTNCRVSIYELGTFYNYNPSAKEIIQRAGKIKKFCGIHSHLLSFVQDKGMDGYIYAVNPQRDAFQR